MKWHRGVPSVRVAVQCHGDIHHVVWKRGALVLEDHDAVADRVVVALGGEPPACLEVLRSWRLGYVEVVPPREAAALVRSLSSIARWMSGGLDEPVVLPEPLRRLREASILHTWGRGLRADRIAEETQAQFLARTITRKVRDVALVTSPWPRQLRVAVQVVDGEPSANVLSIDSGVERGILVQVRPSWLTHVWVPGLESIGDGLVLDLDGDDFDVAKWEVAPDGAWEVVVQRERRDR